MSDHDSFDSRTDQARSAAEKFPDTAKEAARAAARERHRLAREGADMQAQAARADAAAPAD